MRVEVIGLKKHSLQTRAVITTHSRQTSAARTCVVLACSCLLTTVFGFESECQAVDGDKPAAKVASKYPPLVLPDSVLLVPDIAFGRGGDSVLLGDLFLPKSPATDDPLPVMLYIHGGGWRKADRTLRHRCAAYLAERGIAGFSIDYRLSTEASYPAQLHDCKAAVRWLRANAKRLNIDPNRVGVCGGSAGGHLAALTATTGDIPELEGDGGHRGLSTKIQAGVLFYGVYDMEAASKAKMKGLVRLFLGGSIKELPEVYKEASPIQHVNADTPPCLVLYGDKDTHVIIEGSDRFVESLQNAGVETQLVVERGRAHAYDLAEPDLTKVMGPVQRFLFRQFKIDASKIR